MKFQKLILTLTAIMLCVGDTSARTTTSSRPSSSRSSFSSSGRSSFSSSKPSTPSRPSSGFGGMFSSGSSSKPSATKPSSSLSSGLKKLGEKNTVSPTKPATAVPKVAAPKPSTPSYYSSAPRPVKPEAAARAPAGSQVRYEAGRGYGYTDGFGKFILLDAITDIASTAILADVIASNNNQGGTASNKAVNTGTGPAPARKGGVGEAIIAVASLLLAIILGVCVVSVFRK